MLVETESPSSTQFVEAHPALAETERQPESVIKLLLQRVERGYRRGIDDDGHKIGLTFDAGGLAGVVSQAMAKKLSLTGVLDCVDGFYGLSAGGLNALYTAAGQSQEGLDLYSTYMPDNNLVEAARLLPPRLPKMDLGLVRDALLNSRPVNVKKIVDEKIPVIVGATDLSAPLKRPVMFRSTDVDPAHPELFVEQVIAGAHLPLIAGEPIKLSDGHQYTDATMSWTSSIELAQADGCTDVLSLANLPQLEKETGNRKAKVAEFITGKIGDKYLDKHSPKLPSPNSFPVLKEWILRPFHSTASWLLESAIDGTWEWDIKSYKDTLKRKADASEQFSESNFIVDGVNVERLYPPDIPNLPELLTMDKKKLRVGIRGGRLAVRGALEKLRENDKYHG
jgi:hypothetical protein